MDDEALFEWKYISLDRPLSYGERRDALRPKKHVVIVGKLKSKFHLKTRKQDV